MAIPSMQHPPCADLRRCLVVLVLIITTSSLLRQPRHADACVPRERDALLAFKRGVTNDTVNLLASWQEGQLQDDCCRWRGVRCSNRTGHVVELNLRNDPGSSERGLVGQISPSLSSLTRLRRLDLSRNSLEGPTGRVPEFLGSLKNLRYLDLSYVSFSGSVPPQLGNLSKLEYLDLSKLEYLLSKPEYVVDLSELEHFDLSLYNYLGVESLYSTDIAWLTHLPSLQYLNLDFVNLSTIVDWHRVVNLIPSLRVLSLSNCSLSSAKQSLPRVNLTKLEKLDLSYNYFDHPVASCWFWNLTGLQYLKLGGTHLHGQFHDRLGHMMSLQALDLSFSDNLDIMTANLNNLCNLETLNLEQFRSYVNMAKLLELLPQCPSRKLQQLYLQRNNLTGYIPRSIGRFTGLSIIVLYGNHLTGPVPSEISMLTNLTHLDLRHNSLEGVITEEHFANLNSLEYIDLSHNSLKIAVDPEWRPPFRLEIASFASCQMGPLFPAWLQWQVDIRAVDISSAGITDRLPDWFSISFAKAYILNISNNRISGGLPNDMEFMSLVDLYLDSNKLTGQIPPLPRNLLSLYISNNSLSGPLPSNFGAPNLEFLVLSSNYITGHIPGSICDLQSLFTLDLANNLFHGEFPPCFGMIKLTSLKLHNNSFSGKFPSFLQSCSSLVLIDISHNKFSGSLPIWIGDIVKLQFLGLSHNMFSGNIPINITSLRHLQYLNLASNRISGSIPSRLSNLTFMRAEIDSFFGAPFIVGDFLVDTKGQELNYNADNVLGMVSLDLSFNGLTGEIPEEIVSLDAVLNLNLSWNHLSGEVPNKIGAMHALESLDLSKNMLSGEIPSSLSNLTYLSYMDLSYNNLTGRIPPGGQLDTLYDEYPSMYNGNIDLCGPPLHKNCSRNVVPRQDDYKRNEHGFEPLSFYFGLSMGFMLGIWVVFCALLFKKAWRIVYFRLFDKLYDRIYVFVILNRRMLTRQGTTN